MSRIGTKLSAPTAEDKDLLDHAGKAAQLKLRWDAHTGFSEYGDIRLWNPLTEDGDAFRLAAKLRISVAHDGEVFCVGFSGPAGSYAATGNINNEDYSELRRAIVRAAAEIGKLRS
jgi:hypothetical protein